jgi:hypothetical protein
MSTEATPAEAPAAAPAAPPPAPAEEAPEVSPEFQRIQAAIAVAKAGDAAEAQPEAPPAAEPAEPAEPVAAEPEKPDEPAAEPVKIPTLAELEAEVLARRQQREAQPATPEPTREEAARAAETTQDAAAIRAIPIEEFQANPTQALIGAGLNPRDILRNMAQGMWAKQPEAPKPDAAPALSEDAIAELVQQKVTAALKAYQEKQAADDLAAEQAQAVAQAESQFAQLTADKATYAHFSRLSDEERIWYGNRVANQFLAAGRTFTPELIAQVIEQDFATKFGAAPGLPGSGETTQSAAGSEQTPTAPNGPTTLSQSLPAQPSTQREPETEEERVQAAIRVAKAGG